MGCAGAGRADEAWVPMDLAEGQVCAEAVPMGCGQAAWATKGWALEASTAEPMGWFEACAAGPMGRALEASTAEPMGCGQAGQAWAPMGCEQVCAGEAHVSVHGSAVASEPKGWAVACCHMGLEACRMGHEASEARRMGPVVCHMEPLASSPMDVPDGQACAEVVPKELPSAEAVPKCWPSAVAVPKGLTSAEAVPMGCSGASIVDATKGCILRSQRRRRRELQGRKSS